MTYLGYNADVAGPTTSPLSIAFQRFFPALLIKHVRLPADSRYLPTINAVAKSGIDADVLTGNRTTIDGLHRFIAALTRPPDAIELWNEPNNAFQGPAYDGQFASDLPIFAASVAKEFHGIKIWGPSVLPDQNGYPSAVQKLSSSLGSYIDAWNAHSYALGTPENLGYGGSFSNACGASHKEDCGWYGSPNYNDNLSAVMNPNLPGVTTEGAASYGSYPEICGHSNVDAATQQAYVQRGMLYNFKLGHVRIFPYKFVDDGGCSDGFGTYGIMSKLIDQDGQPMVVPKPSYTSLVYLDHIISDDGLKAASFSPQPLTYTLDGETANVEQLLLAESDGSYRLILWSDKSLWNFNANGIRAAGSEEPLSNESFSVRFPQPVNASIYTQVPGLGSWSADAHNQVASIGVVINQYPIVIAVSPQRNNVAASLLPHDVPTPGPTETPRAKRNLPSSSAQ